LDIKKGVEETVLCIHVVCQNSSWTHCGKSATPHCWIPLWSPSKFSLWEAMHQCQRL